MKNLEELALRLTKLLDSRMPALGALNAVDVHVDELVDHVLTPQEQVDAAAALHLWVSSNLADRLVGKVVMLLIPLRNSAVLEQTPPTWESLPFQLAATPPSIYVMTTSAVLQPDPAERFIAPIKAPIPMEPPPAAYYQCWRNPTDPAEEGWARDVRILSLSR